MGVAPFAIMRPSAGLAVRRLDCFEEVSDARLDVLVRVAQVNLGVLVKQTGVPDGVPRSESIPR